MVTVIARPGYLTAALLDRLGMHGQKVHLYDARTDDLFVVAMKSTAIVYALRDDAAPETLSTFEEALRAMGAPGARRLVLVSAGGVGLDAKLATLRKRGVPYIVVETPRLVEDAIDELASAGSRRIWVPGDFKLVAASAESIADAILDALAADSDGAVRSVDAQTMGATEVTARLRMRPNVRASILPRAVYSLGARLGAISATNPSRRFFDRRLTNKGGEHERQNPAGVEPSESEARSRARDALRERASDGFIREELIPLS